MSSLIRALLYCRPNTMWRLTSRFFFGVFAAAIITNAVAVYLLHDVDADRIGNLNGAYWGLTLEFLAFGFVLAGLFFLVTWIGALAFRLRDIPPNPNLALALGIAVTVFQYPAEFLVRKVADNWTEAFLLVYLVVSPVSCAAIILLNCRNRRMINGEITSAPSG